MTEKFRVDVHNQIFSYGRGKSLAPSDIVDIISSLALGCEGFVRFAPISARPSPV